ncbi:hypothetical protein MMC22_004379 [Lobaria immixta]|nr:hypothetical protein [Lobaria immixta]
MCLQNRTYYLCGCLQSTCTSACLASLKAARLRAPHNVTITERYLEERCPRGCRISAFAAEVVGRLEAPSEKKTVTSRRPRRQSSLFMGTALNPEGNENTEQDGSFVAAATAGAEDPGPGEESDAIKLYYPGDFKCFPNDRAAATNASSERNVLIVLQPYRPENHVFQPSSRPRGSYSGVTKKHAAKAKKIKSAP